MQQQQLNAGNWWKAPKERIRVIEQDPWAVDLRPGWVIVLRDLTEEKYGMIYKAPGSVKPGTVGKLIATGELRPQDEPIPLNTRIHVHGYSRGEIRLKWQEKVYDVLQREDILAVEWDWQ